MITYMSNDVQVVLREFPDEIALAINLYGCEHMCKGCHSPELWKEGVELNENALDVMLYENDGITCVGFMGGDNDLERLSELNRYVREKYKLKTGWYSGYSYEDSIFREHSSMMFEFDYVKLGRYVEELGPLDSPTTNQAMFKNCGGTMINITKSFQI